MSTKIPKVVALISAFEQARDEMIMEMVKDPVRWGQTLTLLADGHPEFVASMTEPIRTL